MVESVKSIPPTDENAAARARASTENSHNDPFTATTQNRDRAELQYNSHPSFLSRLNEGASGGGSSIQTQLETPTAQSSNASNTDLMGNPTGAPDKPPAVRKTRAAADIIHKCTWQIDWIPDKEQLQM